MTDSTKSALFTAAETAFESELIGAVAQAAAERLGETGSDAFPADAAALAELLGSDLAWARYGAPVVDAFVHDLETLRAESAR